MTNTPGGQGDLLAATKAAALDLLARKVAEGVMSEAEAQRLFTASLPALTNTIGGWRRGGMSHEAITGSLQGRLAEAQKGMEGARTAYTRHMFGGRVVAAELYLAVWAGIQEDEARYVAGLPEEKPDDRTA